MKTDTYTKAILTVIAVALVALFLQNTNVIQKATASEGKLPYALVPINPNGSIDVNVKAMPSTIDVNIESCDATAFVYAEPIHVKIN